MNYHQLKISPENYNNIKSGTKTFHISRNDKLFQKGDTVEMIYLDSNVHYQPKDYPELTFKIGDVLPLDIDTVVFSLLPENSLELFKERS